MLVKELNSEPQVLEVVKLGKDMFELFDHTDDFDEAIVAAEGVSLLKDFRRDTRNCWIVYSKENEPIGFLYGTIQNQFFTKKKEAVPVFIYVNKRYRMSPASVQLLRTFELWATVHDAKQIKAGAIGDTELTAKRANKFYNRMGYTTIGEAQIKHL